MKKLTALVLALSMLLGASALAEEALEMSDVPGMTAPGVLPIVTEPVTLTIGIPTHTLVTDYEDNFMTKMIEEDTGIDLEFVFYPSAETATVIDLALASGDELPDIIVYAFGNNTASYGAQGYFQPLNEYFEKYSYFFWEAPGMEESDYDAYMLRTAEADGTIYGYSYYTKATGDQVRINPYINRYWLEALDLEMPTNPDELYEVLKAFKEQDPNGNGKADEIPMIGSHNAWNGYFDEMIINYFTYYNTDYMLGVEDDVVYAPFVTEEWQEAMIYMNKLVSEGLLSDLSFTMTLDEMVSMIQSYPPEEQILGFIVGIPVHTFPDPSTTSILAYDAVPPFEDAYTPERTANVTKYAFITADCEHPEVAFRLFDYFAQERVSLITRYGEPGVHFMYRADDPEAFDAMFPNATQAAMSLGWEPIYAEMPGVVNPWVEESNAIWAVHMCCMLPAITYGSQGTTTPADEFVTSWQEGVERGDVQAHRDYLNANSLKWLGQLPEQLFVDPIYTLEEMDMYNNTINTVKEYVRECIAAFATGAMDPVNDWDAYLASLDAAGLQDWLDVAQAYWDRSHAA